MKRHIAAKVGIVSGDPPQIAISPNIVYPDRFDSVSDAPTFKKVGTVSGDPPQIAISWNIVYPRPFH